MLNKKTKNKNKWDTIAFERETCQSNFPYLRKYYLVVFWYDGMQKDNRKEIGFYFFSNIPMFN